LANRHELENSNFLSQGAEILSRISETTNILQLNATIMGIVTSVHADDEMDQSDGDRIRKFGC
jgi:hypothetical protein